MEEEYVDLDWEEKVTEKPQFSKVSKRTQSPRKSIAFITGDEKEGSGNSLKEIDDDDDEDLEGSWKNGQEGSGMAFGKLII